MKRVGRHLAFYSSLLLVWSALAKLQVLPGNLFPTPWAVARALGAGFADYSFLLATGISIKRMVLGYGLSIILGLLLGALVASSKLLDATMGSLLVSLQSLPSICWLPLAVLWFGPTERAILFVVVMGSVLSITISIESGRKQIPRIYSMAGRNLGARGPGLFFFVLLPASLPYIVTGLKQGWAFAWRSLVAGEMIFVTLGLGQLLMLGHRRNDMSQVLAVIILIVAIGSIVDRAVFRTIERQLRRKWGLAAA